MDLHDTQGRRLYLTAAERAAFLAAAKQAALPVRTFCLVLHYTGCRISEALALTLSFSEADFNASPIETTT